MSSSDEIARLINVGATDSHAIMEVITEYVAESNVDPETDEEDVSSGRVNVVKKNYIFDVCCESIPRQVLFIIDEASDTRKKANTVVNLLDYIFEHYGLGEMTASLYTDNCSGQNNNNTIVQYLMCMVLTCLHNTVNLHFHDHWPHHVFPRCVLRSCEEEDSEDTSELS